MLRNQVLVYGAHDIKIDIQRVEVEQRDTELVRCGDGDRARVGNVLADQVGDQRKPPFLGAFNRLLEPLLGNDAILHQSSRQAGEIVL